MQYFDNSTKTYGNVNPSNNLPIIGLFILLFMAISTLLYYLIKNKSKSNVNDTNKDLDYYIGVLNNYIGES